MSPLGGIDWGVYFFFRFQARHHPRVAQAMESAALLGHPVVIGVLLLLASGFFWSARRRRAAFWTLGCAALAFFCGQLTASLVGRPRPPDAQNYLGSAPPDGGLWFPVASRSSPAGDWLDSFPACEILVFTYVVATLAIAAGGLPVVPRFAMRVVLILLALALWLSQFFLGLHFLTDILAALAGGLALAGLVAGIAGRELCKELERFPLSPSKGRGEKESRPS